MDAEPKTTLSFSFSKRTDAKKLQASAIGETDHVKNEETDYLVSLEDNKIQSFKPVVEEAPLVIPLIQNNRWRHAKKPEELETVNNACDDSVKKAPVSSIETQSTGDEETDKAVKELLSDVAKFHEKLSNGSAADSNLTIPLLMQNKVPDGYETDDKLDVGLRPDEATEEDYDKVPIEQFGLAMLRGMGWKDGQGIGKSQKVVKPLEPVLRPKGLGLGADKSMALQKAGSKIKSTADDKEEEELSMRKGSHCMITTGRYDGQYATIAGIDEDNTRVVISLAVGREMINMSQFGIKLVSKKEFDKFSKYINKGKVDKYKEKESGSKSSRGSDGSDTRHHKHSGQERQDGCDARLRKSESRHSDRHSDRKNSRGRDEDEYESQTQQHRHRDHRKESSADKYKHRDSNGAGCNTDRKRKHSPSESPKERLPSPVSFWVQPNLRVRIIDKDYKNGRLFKTKVTIVDVISSDSFICRTDEGQVLEDLRQSQLETVVPHHTPAFVMIVSGKHRAQLAQMLEKDKDRCSAIVQLLSDRDVALKLNFDNFCEYVGDVLVDD